MSKQKILTKKVMVKVSDDWLSRFDAWRDRQALGTTRSDVLRRLVDQLVSGELTISKKRAPPRRDAPEC